MPKSNRSLHSYRGGSLAMRNYVMQQWAKINYDRDINPPNPPVPEVGYVMSPDVVRLQSDVDAFIADLQTNPQNINIVSTFKGPLYWLLDKANLDLILQFAGLSAMQVIDQFGSYPNYIYSGPNDNPRSGWTDNDGVKRNPPPSEAKGPTSGGSKFDFISLANYLSQIYAIFVVKPNPTPSLKRLLADLLTAIKLAIAKKITQAQIDNIFAELAAQGL